MSAGANVVTIAPKKKIGVLHALALGMKGDNESGEEFINSLGDFDAANKRALAKNIAGDLHLAQSEVAFTI